MKRVSFASLFPMTEAAHSPALVIDCHSNIIYHLDWIVCVASRHAACFGACPPPSYVQPDRKTKVTFRVRASSRAGRLRFRWVRSVLFCSLRSTYSYCVVRSWRGKQGDGGQKLLRRCVDFGWVGRWGAMRKVQGQFIYRLGYLPYVVCRNPKSTQLSLIVQW